jgi:hypothetical protein
LVQARQFGEPVHFPDAFDPVASAEIDDIPQHEACNNTGGPFGTAVLATNAMHAVKVRRTHRP